MGSRSSCPTLPLDIWHCPLKCNFLLSIFYSIPHFNPLRRWDCLQSPLQPLAYFPSSLTHTTHSLPRLVHLLIYIAVGPGIHPGHSPFPAKCVLTPFHFCPPHFPIHCFLYLSSLSLVLALYERNWKVFFLWIPILLPFAVGASLFVGNTFSQDSFNLHCDIIKIPAELPFLA